MHRLVQVRPKESPERPLHDTDSESSDDESATATVSVPTVMETDLNATTNEADESFEESVTVVTQSEMAACIYCARLFKNGCVKRHQNYCAERI